MHKAEWDKYGYYKILGLKPGAGMAEIKHAYRQMAKQFHPDINDAPDAHERFIEITEAYEILVNRNLQVMHDRREAEMDAETLRAEYERLRKEARENARRYARMKYEKFQREQEAFKKSGWHDLILTVRYIIRVLVFPLIILFAAMPLISPEVSEHPSGYVMFWLFSSLLILFVVNHRKDYFRLGPYYYSFQEIYKLIKKSAVVTDNDCYYCRGEKAMVAPHKIEFFRIKKVELKSYGALYGRTTGMERHIKTVCIPRSRKAFLVHLSSTLAKIICIALCLWLIKKDPWSAFGFPAGIFSGSLCSFLITIIFRTKPKTSYLLSMGMIIKILIWLVCIYLFGAYAIFLLFFDPIFEATMRYFSRDRLFLPILKQHPDLEILFSRGYQLYLELPVWSVINPFFRWLF
jgi:curved DNA-binding protein CbpA